MALVATSDVGFGLMRLGAVDVEMAGVAVQAFRDIDQAMTWLRA